MTEVTNETAVVPFASSEVLEAFASSVANAFGKFDKASRNLVGQLLGSARSLERVVTDEDFAENLAKITRKAIAAKVSKDSVKVYLSHAKAATIAATGRPPISDALPLGKHWADQRTSGRKLEGVNAYYKRVSALLKLATRNEDGHLVLPEGYSLLGETTASLEAAAPEGETPQGSAGQSADAEGGLNVDPAKAKADAMEAAATVLMGNAKAAAALLALLADADGKQKLAELMAKHAHAKAEEVKRKAANEKAGAALNKAA